MSFENLRLGTLNLLQITMLEKKKLLLNFERLFKKLRMNNNIKIPIHV